MRKLLPAGAVADLLGVTEQTLANWRYMGKGPRYYRVGGIRYDEADLERWIEEHAVNGETAA